MPVASTNKLGEFLRAHRARLDPADVGLRGGGDRRVAGLRREEVAVLAGVSIDYYTRLEQGRERHPSAQVLDAIGRALKLKTQAVARAAMEQLAIPASAVADAIGYALGRPGDVNVNELVVRPTAQG
ncbi:helix-turn-helix domain-containing protein [Streptosporangium subroseum]|uniref:helix-turn-helix domain-containing protein n=1 Tax=Streptosporangium subroseum TaxID=106412 RepID=UPI003F4DF646